MLRNYFKTAWRNIRKHSFLSFINIFGLAIGLTCCVLIVLFIYDELSYDHYPAQAKNIYRVDLSVNGNGDVAVYPKVDVAVGEGMKEAFPEVKASTRISPASDYVKYDEKQFKEEHLAFSDSNFLQMFSIPLTEGDEKTALVQPKCIVISKSFAKKYFGNEDPIGRTLLVGTANSPYKVTGVFDKVPDNSHFHFDAFLSITSFPITKNTWSNLGYYTYLLLNKNTDPKALEAKFPQLVEKYVVPEVQHDMGVSLEEAQKSVNSFRFTLMPLEDIHLYSSTKYELEPNGDIRYIYIFGALALFILLIACVNFVNLSTATAARRAKEIGIRKVVGSVKKNLIFQFITESVLLTFFATLLALGITILLLPYFNQLAGKHIEISSLFSTYSVPMILLTILIVGIVSGIYPAFFLSSFNAIKVLKGNTKSGSRKSALRSSLVVFQFFISIALIISTIVTYQQLQYMQNKKLGYDHDQVLFLPEARLLGTNQTAYEQQLLQDSRVVSASISRSVPASEIMDGTEIYPKNEASNGTEIHANIYHIDYDYLRTLGIHLLQGRNFSKDFSTDSSAVIINEAAVQKLGWNDSSAIGKSIVRSGQKEFKVIGVVEDFHYASVKQQIAPLMMLLGNNYGGLIVKIKTGDVNGFLADAKNEWSSFHPAGPFTYLFLDESFANMYLSEQRTSEIFSIFSLLAILIASLGLFGLTAVTVEHRTKEIGVRKVLGASIPQLLTLLSQEFLMLICIAFVIAIPVAWWSMSAWLQSFAYRIQMNAWVFVLAGMTAILVAMITISFQAIRAAIANPVKSLRTE